MRSLAVPNGAIAQRHQRRERMRRRRAEDVVVGQVAVAQLLAPDERVVRVVVGIRLPDEEDREHDDDAGREQQAPWARRRRFAGGAARVGARAPWFSAAVPAGASRACWAPPGPKGIGVSEGGWRSAGRALHAGVQSRQVVDLDHRPGPLVRSRPVVERAVVGEAHRVGALRVGRERDRVIARRVERGGSSGARCAGRP